MKKIAFIFLLFVSFSLKAQENDFLVKAFTSFQNNELGVAKTNIDKVIEDVNLRWSPKAWFIKAMIYHAIYESESPEFMANRNKVLDETYQAYLKTIELDVKKEYNVDIKKRLLVVSNQFSNRGVDEYNQYKYAEALNSFEKSLEIQKMPMIFNVDTMGIYNAAMSALNSNNNAKAKEYFQKLIDLNYGGAKIFVLMSELFQKEKNFDKSIEILNKALSKHPEEYTIIVDQLINVYLSDNRIAEAKNTLNDAVAKNPKNSQYYYVISSLYDTEKEFEIVEKNLLKALELKPDYIDAANNLAILYYNQAIIVNKSLNGITDNMLYKAEKDKVEVLFKKSIPYFEKVRVAMPNDVQTKDNLKFLYSRYAMTEKLNSL